MFARVCACACCLCVHTETSSVQKVNLTLSLNCVTLCCVTWCCCRYGNETRFINSAPTPAQANVYFNFKVHNGRKAPGT